MLHARAMGLRSRGRSGTGRALYWFVRDRRVITIHAFLEKTHATPRRDLAIARQRAKEIQGG